MEICGSTKTTFNQSEPCNELINEMNSQIGGYFVYALYDDCVYDNLF